MKADALYLHGFPILFVACGLQRVALQANKYGRFRITPVTRTGEESQGYHVTPPSNPINTASYPKCGGASSTISSGYSGRMTDRLSLTPPPTARALLSSIRVLDQLQVIRTKSIFHYQHRKNDRRMSGWRLVRSTGASVTIPSASLASGRHLTIISGRESENAAFHQNSCTTARTPRLPESKSEVYAASRENHYPHGQQRKNGRHSSY